MDYAAAEEQLNALSMFGIKLGLDAITRLLQLAGSPERGLRFLHLAGSNGKGSVGAMLAAGLHHAGFQVGFFSSPHLISVRERFRINGKAMPSTEFTELMEMLAPAIATMRGEGQCPTYFEVNVALAALYFQRHRVDWAVWETGMGGRLDATNTITPELSIITGISLEHQQYLGHTLRAIAGEKAGIIKPGVPVFTGMMPDEASAVIAARAAELQAPLYRLPDAYCHPVDPVFHAADFTQEFTLGDRRLKLRLAGRVQQRNAALALQVLEYLAPLHHFSLDAAVAGMAATVWPGRLQRLPRGLILDGAHNPEGAVELAATLSDYFPGQRFNIVFGGLADKDTVGVLRALATIARQFVFVPMEGPRPSHPPARLAALLAQVDPVMPSSTAADLGEAVDRVLGNGGPVLIAGSLYLAGKVLSDLLPPQRTLDIE